MSTSIVEVVTQYQEGLADLKINSKPIITNLSIIAGEILKEHGEAGASTIAALIEKHIASTSAECKLPALYLLDSIVKNLRGVYLLLFQRNLPETFLGVYSGASPSVRRSLDRLRNSWRGVFDDATLATIERTLAPAAAPLQLQLGNAQPVANLFSTGSQALQLGGAAGFSGGRDSYYEAQGSAMYGFQGTILPQTLPYGHGTEYGLSGAPQLGSSILPPGGRAYQAGWFGSVPQHPQSAFPSTAPSAGAGAELRSLLGILAQQQQTSALGAADSEGAPRGQFTSAALRAPHAGVVHSLYAAQPMQCPTTGRRFRDQATFTRHIDAMYLKQRAAQEAANASRRWFVSSEARSVWLSGVTAAAMADHGAVGRFGEALGGEEAEPELEVSVPADESQPTCALSGEPFEIFWNDEQEDWHYRGVVRLTHPVGGAPAGALVLKNAIPSAPGQASSVSATSIGSIEAAAVGDALREGGSDGGGAQPLNIVVKSEVVEDEIGGARKRRADEATICESGDNAESSKRLKADEPQELDAVTVPLT